MVRALHGVKSNIMAADEKIVTIPIHDKNGNFLGNATGRREQLERYNNRDLAEQIQRDNAKVRDQQQRR